MFLELYDAMDGRERPKACPISTAESIANISRRRFLVGTGAFTVGIALGSHVSARDDESIDTLTDVRGGDATPSLWVTIEQNGTVKITCHRAEMGQQVWTSMAQIIADELEADWDTVEIVQATGDSRYGDQNTDGSRSVRFNFHRLRVAGAAMRSMLCRAAAAQWDVHVAECRAELGYVVRGNQRLSYGDLAAAAGALSLPSEAEVSLKPRKDWRYIGKPVPSLTVPRIVRGQGTFGIDVDRPGMVYAVIARPPQVFGTTGAVNDKRANAVPGVLQTVRLPDATAPAMFKPLGGVAVVATDTWAAIQGRNALEIEWQDGPNAGYTSSEYRKALQTTSRAPGNVRRNRGDAIKALEIADKTLSAEYYVPHLAQSPMEPPTATAEWDGDRLTCWAPVQDAQTTRNTLVSLLGLEPENVTVHATWLGGAFGRKSKCDFVVEAAIVTRKVGKPVKVTWTREDDIKHGYYHSVSYQRFEAALDDNGRCNTFLHRTVFPPIPSIFNPAANEASALELSLGATDTPFDIENLRLETGVAPAHVRIGWLRSVAHIYHAFGVQSFVAELAHAAGRDPKDYLLELIGPPRYVDPTKEGAVDYTNAEASLEEYPIDTGRLANVTRIVADMAKWGRKLPKGHGLGIAAHRSFLSYIGTVVEVAVADDGSLSIPNVWVAADAGTVVNPRHARAQLEGGTLYGLSNALFGEITATNGVIDQSNFPTWRLMRMNEAPLACEVNIIESDAPPAGIGEPGTPGAAPALANAIFDAVGVRIRELPILGAAGRTLSLKSLNTT